ncbi:hypothetical protein FB451DRAFT_1164104 [Mycena latifolia]|nr:hypothetical protein FB451DRAFT_1164104 [Mycena latifolia]
MAYNPPKHAIIHRIMTATSSLSQPKWELIKYATDAKGYGRYKTVVWAQCKAISDKSVTIDIKAEEKAKGAEVCLPYELTTSAGQFKRWEVVKEITNYRGAYFEGLPKEPFGMWFHPTGEISERGPCAAHITSGVDHYGNQLLWTAIRILDSAPPGSPNCVEGLVYYTVRDEERFGVINLERRKSNHRRLAEFCKGHTGEWALSVRTKDKEPKYVSLQLDEIDGLDGLAIEIKKGVLYWALERDALILLQDKQQNRDKGKGRMPPVLVI